MERDEADQMQVDQMKMVIGQLVDRLREQVDVMQISLDGLRDVSMYMEGFEDYRQASSGEKAKQLITIVADAYKTTFRTLDKMAENISTFEEVETTLRDASTEE